MNRDLESVCCILQQEVYSQQGGDLGICDLVQNATGIKVHPSCFTGWFYHSGERMFPVPGVVLNGNDRTYDCSQPMATFNMDSCRQGLWKGEAGKLRRGLAHFVIGSIYRGELRMRHGGKGMYIRRVEKALTPY